MAMSPAQQLRSVLQSELNIATLLAELLDGESKALAVSDIASITEINHKKTAAYRQTGTAWAPTRCGVERGGVSHR